MSKTEKYRIYFAKKRVFLILLHNAVISIFFQRTALPSFFFKMDRLAWTFLDIFGKNGNKW